MGVPDSADDAALSLQNVYKTYGLGKDTKTVLEDISFDVRRGALVSVVGASGAGKTTFINCVASLIPVSGGVVRVFGKEVTQPSDEIGMVFQDYHRSLFPWFRVARNVELPLLDKGIPRDERNRRVSEALAQVGLGEDRNKRLSELSGGMRQRVAIARALAYRPKVLLLDEPFGSLDAQTRADLQDVTLELKRKLDITMLFVTHDIDEAIYLGDRVIVLDGRSRGIADDIEISLGEDRDQLTTKSTAEFDAARSRLVSLIRASKK